MFEEEYVGYMQEGEYDYLMHYGTPHDGQTSHSGRYQYGSGANPNQRSGDFVSRVKKHRNQGLAEKEIAEALKKDFGIDVDKKKVLLSETIKVAGCTKVDIKLNEGVMAKVSVMVMPKQ